MFVVAKVLHIFSVAGASIATGLLDGCRAYSPHQLPSQLLTILVMRQGETHVFDITDFVLNKHIKMLIYNWKFGGCGITHACAHIFNRPAYHWIKEQTTSK